MLPGTTVLPPPPSLRRPSKLKQHCLATGARCECAPDHHSSQWVPWRRDAQGPQLPAAPTSPARRLALLRLLRRYWMSLSVATPRFIWRIMASSVACRSASTGTPSCSFHPGCSAGGSVM